MSSASSPDNPASLVARGLEAHRVGRLADAERLYRAALALDAKTPSALHYLGIVASQSGQVEAALALIDQSIGLAPAVAEFHMNRGDVLASVRRTDEAALAYRQAQKLGPKSPDPLIRWATLLAGVGKAPAAAEKLRAALRLDPASVDARVNLATLDLAAGHAASAARDFRKAVALHPAHRGGLEGMAGTFHALSAFGDAVTMLRRRLAATGPDAGVLGNLAVALRRDGRSRAAERVSRRGIALSPVHQSLLGVVAALAVSDGRLDEARRYLRRSLSVDPRSATSHSALLYVSQFDPATTLASALAAARDWDERHARPLAGTGPRAPRSGSRRLRVGFVSPDLGRHPVGYFLLPALEHRDREAYEVACYSDRAVEDEISARIRTLSDRWVRTGPLSDDALAERVAKDGIDVLIDLAGHTAGNRLLVFARKPAPVQATWLGYFDTTGVSAIDHVFTDRWETPEGGEHGFSESVVRLASGRLCYGPPGYAPDVTVPSPRDPVFGSFNNLAKLGDGVLRLWAKILDAVPGSRLLLKWGTLGDAVVRDEWLRRMESVGIAQDRLEFRGPSPHAAMLAEYGDVDVALDPFPYTGGLTSCEALWMGVPLVTLAGNRPVGRQTVSFLSRIGREDMIADTEERYVEIASRLAADPAHRRDMRAAQRARMAASPLTDGVAAARSLEQALADIRPR